MPFVISVKHSLIYRKNQGQSRMITDLIIPDIYVNIISDANYMQNCKVEGQCQEVQIKCQDTLLLYLPAFTHLLKGNYYHNMITNTTLETLQYHCSTSFCFYKHRY